VDDPAVLVRLGNLKAPWVVLSLVGVLIIGVLMARKVRGAILIGMIGTAILGTFISGGMHQGEADKLVQSQGGIFAAPPSIAPTIFKLDLASFFKSGSNFWALWEIVFIFLILDLFDTIGTLIGVGHSAGLLTEDGKLPRAGKALISDAIGTVTGAALGTSTVTSYIESSTGVAAGGRTGLANIVTGCLFLLAIFFEPLIKMVGGGYNIALEGDPVMKYPIIAGPLIIVGSLMMKGLRDVDWDDHSIAISAFITVIIMPLTFSISTGISFGFITYTLINLLSGKGKDVHWLMYVISVVFLFRYIWVG
ncbi:MAG TPA: NCS2 family permease, partial [bacterium]